MGAVGASRVSSRFGREEGEGERKKVYVSKRVVFSISKISGEDF